MIDSTAPGPIETAVREEFAVGAPPAMLALALSLAYTMDTAPQAAVAKQLLDTLRILGEKRKDPAFEEFIADLSRPV